MTQGLLQDVFEAMAELGQAQWVAGGDWNEEVAAIWEVVAAGKVGDHARGWLMAWRWLQDFGTAASTGRVEAEARRLLTRLGGCLPRLGVIWDERQLLIPGAHPDRLGAWVDDCARGCWW